MVLPHALPCRAGLFAEWSARAWVRTPPLSLSNLLWTTDQVTDVCPGACKVQSRSRQAANLTLATLARRLSTFLLHWKSLAARSHPSKSVLLSLSLLPRQRGVRRLPSKKECGLESRHEYFLARAFLQSLAPWIPMKVLGPCPC